MREVALRYNIPMRRESGRASVYLISFLPAVHETLPERLQQALPPITDELWRVSFESPAAEGATYLGRNHPFETIAKVPRQTAESGCACHGEGVDLGFRAFLQWSPAQPDPNGVRGTPKNNS